MFTSRFAFVLATALVAAGSCLAAGGEPKEKEKKTPRQLVSSSVKSSETGIPRIWFGLTGSFTPMKLVTGRPNGVIDSNGNIFTSKSANGQVGGGVILNVRVFRSYWLSAGGIYRFTGYDALAAYNDLNQTQNAERTRVRLLDIPVMVRYTGRKYNISKYTFYELGGVVRDGISLKTTTNAVDAVTGNLGPGPTTGTSYKRLVPGAIAGFGAIAKDDFGIIVSPEVRYTRWMGQTFNSPIIGSQRNQLEVTVSFGF